MPRHFDGAFYFNTKNLGCQPWQPFELLIDVVFHLDAGAHLGAVHVLAELHAAAELHEAAHYAAAAELRVAQAELVAVAAALHEAAQHVAELAAVVYCRAEVNYISAENIAEPAAAEAA